MNFLVRTIFVGGALVSFLSAAVNPSTTPQNVSRENKIAAVFVESLTEQLSERMALPKKLFNISVESFSVSPSWVGPPPKSMQILGLGVASFRRVDGLFQTSVLASGAAGTVQLQASGILKVAGPAYVARQSLLRGQTISQDDLTQTIVPWSTLPTGVAAQPWQTFVGRRVRSYVSAGQAVAIELLDEAVVVQNGELVELTLYAGPGVLIRSRAIAKQEGRVGEVIRLEQPDTKKIMSGAIIGKKSVEVRM